MYCHFTQLDLCSIKSVFEFCESVRVNFSQLDCIICNAGRKPNSILVNITYFLFLTYGVILTTDFMYFDIELVFGFTFNR